MGMSPFGKCCVYPCNSKVFAPNPDPLKFEIQLIYQIEKNVVAKIKYPDCINFEGIKILVFQGTTCEIIEELTSIDPHFSKNGISPFARFRPTEEGWEMALRLASTI